jgi:hypothetical protein
MLFYFNMSFFLQSKFFCVYIMFTIGFRFDLFLSWKFYSSHHSLSRESNFSMLIALFNSRAIYIKPRFTFKSKIFLEIQNLIFQCLLGNLNLLFSVNLLVLVTYSWSWINLEWNWSMGVSQSNTYQITKTI